MTVLLVSCPRWQALRSLPETAWNENRQKPWSSQDPRNRYEQQFNWDTALEQADGIEKALKDIAEMFMEQYPKLVQGIRDSIENGDMSELRSNAHTLRGSAAVLSAEPIVRAAYRLETHGTEKGHHGCGCSPWGSGSGAGAAGAGAAG